MSPEAASPHAAILQFLLSLQSPARILVAISGGSDSTGLLLLLDDAVKAASHLSITLCAATIDHRLRAGSTDEAQQVAALCASLGIPHIITAWQGEKPKTGIMAAAREARYNLLAESAERFGANLIVTGHTLDDQRETLQMRGMRTEQLSSGIADAVLFDRRFWILRPLLLSSRADIRAFLEDRGVPWIDDPTNEDVKYERVRVRRQLPADRATETDIRAAWEARLALSLRAAEWLERHFRLHGGLLGQISVDGLRQDRAVLDYALGRLTAVFGGQTFVPGRAHMDRLRSFATGGEPGRMTVGRVVFDHRRDGLYFTRESRGLLPLVLRPGEAGVWDGRFYVRNWLAAPVKVEAAAAHSPSFLCLSQESVAPKSLGAGDITRRRKQSFTARTRGGWIPVTSTGMREDMRHLPKAAWKRAIASAPALSSEGAYLSPESAGAIHLMPYFAPFDRFLTRFDFIFADRLSAVFAMAPYAGLPFRSIDGKTI
ncbi:tRNA(Ile)-lysidine synthase [Rhizobium binae]|uniref:tRNA(Ile)-lysidine synthase n=1 Tax=Rhizobium binae TaxID=1138190 RepID=A0ABV2MHR3_9HYPH|nr:tRNA lysidine(34) synthetase TilS [Rhizobium binae]MBX4961470.1 tRNA lysidine(34) synthetase TilS [Rhizobium binae]MBX4991389.1 tRNA lysidine(34) synthetase TilS [Rhizobium binae]NKL48496.1 tRNA lysidine(34) synthetase TilS [Rhizobium leguminosarum bv. viciae]QSY81585.1 tRNA lysidine(34) synthetase TilS [Rhizobium binae]